MEEEVALEARAADQISYDVVSYHMKLKHVAMGGTYHVRSREVVEEVWHATATARRNRNVQHPSSLFVRFFESQVPDIVSQQIF